MVERALRTRRRRRACRRRPPGCRKASRSGSPSSAAGAVDKGANQPSTFPDPKSSEGGVPYFSNGRRDDLIQRRFLEAVLAHLRSRAWRDARQAIRCRRSMAGGWSTRPTHPSVDLGRAAVSGVSRGDAMSGATAANWETGHWLTGRLGCAPLDALVATILADAGITDVDCVALEESVDGYVIDRPMSPRAALEPLALAYAFDAAEVAGVLSFRPRGGDAGRRARRGRSRAARRIARRRAWCARRKPSCRARSRSASPMPAPTTGAPRSHRAGWSAALRAQAMPISPWSRTTPPPSGAPTSGCRICGRAAKARTSRCRRAGLRSPAATSSASRSAAGAGCVEIRSITDAERARDAGAVDRSRGVRGAAGGAAAAAAEAAAAARPGRRRAARSADADRPTSRRCSCALRCSPIPGRDRSRSGAPTTGLTLRAPRAGAGAVDRRRNARRSAGRADQPLGPREPRARAPLWRRAGIGHRHQVLNGANAAAVQRPDGAWEVLQFANAELVGERTYELSRLLRGQMGSEWAMDEPLAGGRAVRAARPACRADRARARIARPRHAAAHRRRRPRSRRCRRGGARGDAAGDRAQAARAGASSARSAPAPASTSHGSGASAARCRRAGTSRCRSAKRARPTSSTFSPAARWCARSSATTHRPLCGGGRDRRFRQRAGEPRMSACIKYRRRSAAALRPKRRLISDLQSRVWSVRSSLLSRGRR